MKMFKQQIELHSHGERPTYVNITEQVKKAIAESGISDGVCFVISPHTTCSVFYEEYVHDRTEDGDEFLQADLNDALRKILPDHKSADDYRYPGDEHFKAVSEWPEAADYLPTGTKKDLFNGDAHLRATLIGSSQTFDVSDGKLGVGKTGYVYFVDFDTTHPRTRKCKITVMGE